MHDDTTLCGRQGEGCSVHTDGSWEGHSTVKGRVSLQLCCGMENDHPAAACCDGLAHMQPVALLLPFFQERKADKDAAAAAAVMAVFAQGACNGDGSSSSTATIAMPEGAFSGCMRPLKAALVC